MTKEERRARDLARYHERMALLRAELGGKCVACGATEGLEFDHIDRDSKSRAVSKITNLEAARVEAAKCQLLCRPCHEAKTACENRSPLRRRAWEWNLGDSTQTA